MALPIPAYADIARPPRMQRAGRAALRTLDHIAHDPLALVGLILLLAVVVCSIAAPLIAPYNPNYIDVAHRLQGPTGAHLFGTDELGRDLLSRVMYGGRVSLSVSAISIVCAATIGTALGGLAGLLGGVTETVIMRVSDILLSFPAILFAIVLIAFLRISLNNVVIAIAVAYIPSFIRVA